MPLVIHGLGGGHTHTHTNAYIHTEVILRNQACAWFKSVKKPLKTITMSTEKKYVVRKGKNTHCAHPMKTRQNLLSKAFLVNLCIILSKTLLNVNNSHLIHKRTQKLPVDWLQEILYTKLLVCVKQMLVSF